MLSYEQNRLSKKLKLVLFQTSAAKLPSCYF